MLWIETIAAMLSYNLKETEYVSGSVLLGRWSLAKKIIVMLVLLGVVALEWFYWRHGKFMGWAPAGMCMFGAIFGDVVGRYCFRSWYEKRTFRKLKVDQVEQSIAWDDKLFTIAVPLTLQSLPWSDFVSVRENPLVFVLWHQSCVGFIVPKRVLTETQQRDFSDCLRSISLHKKTEPIVSRIYLAIRRAAHDSIPTFAVYMLVGWSLLSAVTGFTPFDRGQKPVAITPVAGPAQISANSDMGMEMTLKYRFNESIFTPALAAYNERQFGRAEALLRQILADTPDETNASVLLSFALTPQREYDEATRVLTNALKLEPRSSGALSALGNVDAAKGYYDTAIENYSRALAMRPMFIPAIYHRGVAFFMKRDLVRARADFETCIRYLNMSNSWAIRARQQLGLIETVEKNREKRVRELKNKQGERSDSDGHKDEPDPRNRDAQP